MPDGGLRGGRELLTDADCWASPVSDTLPEDEFLSTRHPRIRAVAVRIVEPIAVAGAEPREPPWFRSVGRTFADLLSLPEDWNSYRARRVDPRAAERALELLLAIMPEDGPLPVIVPTHGGGVQLEWHRAGADLEVDLTPSGSVHVYFEDPEANVKVEAEMSSDRARLKNLVLRLARPR